MWWTKVRKFVVDLFPDTNRTAQVVYGAPSLRGHEDSHFEWRLKRRADGIFLISLKLIPDYSVDQEGFPVEYHIDFAPEDVNQIKAGLDACLAECERIKAEPEY
jgi:hypothetical protein